MRGESQLALEICFQLLPPSNRSIDRLPIKSVYGLKIRAGLFDVVVAIVACLPAACCLPLQQTTPMYVVPSLRRVGVCSQATRQHLAQPQSQSRKKGNSTAIWSWLLRHGRLAVRSGLSAVQLIKCGSKYSTLNQLTNIISCKSN